MQHQTLPSPPDDAPEGTSCVKIALKPPLAVGDKALVDVYTVYSGLLELFPATVKQGEPQRTVLEDNVFALSPYDVGAQSTAVSLLSSLARGSPCIEPPFSGGPCHQRHVG